MKYCVIVPDGMADDPREELEGETWTASPARDDWAE